MTTLLDDHLYEQTGRKKQNIVITKNIVVEKLAGIASDQDLSRYIL
jgi:ATP-dependent protease HslVU (ClpYQ) ATPase subunit